MSFNLDPPSLSEETAAVEHEFPLWHVRVLESGRIQATTGRSLYGGSGATLDAPTAAVMRRDIADWEHTWDLGMARAS